MKIILKQIIIIITLSTMLGLFRNYFIEDNNVLPAFSSSFILSNISIFASTAIPMERIVAATPDNSNVTPINLNKANNKVEYINSATPATNPGIL